MSPHAPEPERSSRSWPFLAVWAFVALVGVGTLAAGHLLTLPTPTTFDPRLVQAMQPTDQDPRWSATHFLRGECGCSQRIATYLIARRPLPNVRERVVLVTGDDALHGRLAAAGFSVVEVTEEELLGTFGVEGVPLLAIATERGDVRYVGGYTARKQGPVPQDRTILRDLQAGKPVEALPMFGCATNEKLRQATDPFGIR